jgi:hypothetical protein
MGGAGEQARYGGICVYGPWTVQEPFPMRGEEGGCRWIGGAAENVFVIPKGSSDGTVMRRQEDHIDRGDIYAYLGTIPACISPMANGQGHDALNHIHTIPELYY